MARQELACFLRDRRADLGPADVGLPAGPRRRTPGLRREEVARLASMSVEYYARIEQARGPRPSPRILDALAGALRLTPAERTHLFRLAGTSPAPPPGPARRVRPYVADLLRPDPGSGGRGHRRQLRRDRLEPARRGPAGQPGGPAKPGQAAFPGPGWRRSSGGEEFSHIVVARLREAADRYPRDERLARLLAELRAGSEEFVQVWETNPVRAPGHRSKTFTHPEIGAVRINCDVLAVPDDDRQVVFMTADPGSPSARALRHLLRRADSVAGQVA